MWNIIFHIKDTTIDESLCLETIYDLNEQLSEHIDLIGDESLEEIESEYEVITVPKMWHTCINIYAQEYP